MSNGDRQDDKRDEVSLDVATPKGPFRHPYPGSTSVGAVIEDIITAKELDRKDSFELIYGETVLQPVNRTLASFGLHGHAKLELVATGSGV